MRTRRRPLRGSIFGRPLLLDSLRLPIPFETGDKLVPQPALKVRSGYREGAQQRFAAESLETNHAQDRTFFLQHPRSKFMSAGQICGRKPRTLQKLRDCGQIGCVAAADGCARHHFAQQLDSEAIASAFAVGTQHVAALGLAAGTVDSP